MTGMRVLIVEDQVTLADDIADGLRDQGMAADVAYDGASGLEKALLNRYDVVFDRARRRVSRGGRPVSLNRKEMGVLEVLLAADGSVVSAEELLERVWDENADPFSHTVTVTLARLRRKLGEPELIETVVGSGYRLP